MAKTTAKTSGLSLLNAKNIEAPWLQVFIMGEIGSGKTTLASTFPRPLFLVPKNEQSMLTLKGLDFPYIEIDSMRGPLVNGVGGMLSAVTAIENEYHANIDGFPYDTLVVESVGHYGDIVQRELSGGTQAMDQQKWGLFLSHFLDIQARLRKLDVNLVWTSHTKIEKVNDSTAICGVNLSGQAATKIPSSCDIVIYAESGTAKEPRFRAHFKRHLGFHARSRFQHPAMIENCTFDHIMAYVNPPVE